MLKQKKKKLPKRLEPEEGFEAFMRAWAERYDIKPRDNYLSETEFATLFRQRRLYMRAVLLRRGSFANGGKKDEIPSWHMQPL